MWNVLLGSALRQLVFRERYMKFYSKPVEEHPEVPLADNGRWEEIVEQWEQRESVGEGAVGKNRCYVVSVGTDKNPLNRAAQLKEILKLVESQGDEVVGDEVLHLSKHNSKMLFGSGTAEEIAVRARNSSANLIVLDAELSPTQLRNLEDQIGMSVADRESVILNVFLRHARTRRAQIQVEIAQLEYLRPRIRGVGINMDQQTGGLKGGRGPGETASELLARKLDRRVDSLRKTLAKLKIAGNTQRLERKECKRITLVGYTNAGKTTLMNSLTGSELSARDMPFETLDTTSRSLSRYGGNVIISDTVGFIRRLPERLLESFESTLIEVKESSLVAIVVDSSDNERDLHLKTTVQILEKLGVGEIPRIYIFNKADLLVRALEEEELRFATEGHPYFVVSSYDSCTIEALKERLLTLARSSQQQLTLVIPYQDSKILSKIYKNCRILESEAITEGLRLKVEGESWFLDAINESVKELL